MRKSNLLSRPPQPSVSVWRGRHQLERRERRKKEMLKMQLLIQTHIVAKALPMPTTFPLPQSGLLIPGFPGKPSLRSKENTSTPILWALEPYKDILTAPQHPLDDGLALTYHLLPLRRWTGNLIHTHTPQMLVNNLISTYDWGQIHPEKQCWLRWPTVGNILFSHTERGVSGFKERDLVNLVLFSRCQKEAPNSPLPLLQPQ